MKSVFLAMILFGVFSQAHACLGEAQLIGTVKSIKKTPLTCNVFLTADSILTPSGVCPLDEMFLAQEGISVGLIDGHDCAYNVGDSISGILVDDGVEIHLESR